MKLKLELFNQVYRVRFTHSGKRLCVSFGTNDHATATRLCRKLELDLLNGTLQANLKAYSLKYEQSITPVPSRVCTPGLDKGKGKLLITWDEWLGCLDLPAKTINGHYHATRQVIPPNIAWDDVQWFKAYSESVSPRTVKDRKSLGLFQALTLMTLSS